MSRAWAAASTCCSTPRLTAFSERRRSAATPSQSPASRPLQSTVRRSSLSASTSQSAGARGAGPGWGQGRKGERAAGARQAAGRWPAQVQQAPGARAQASRCPPPSAPWQRMQGSQLRNPGPVQERVAVRLVHLVPPQAGHYALHAVRVGQEAAQQAGVDGAARQHRQAVVLLLLRHRWGCAASPVLRRTRSAAARRPAPGPQRGAARGWAPRPAPPATSASRRSPRRALFQGL